MDVSKVYNTNDDNNSNWTNSGSSSSNSTTATSVPNTEHLHVASTTVPNVLHMYRHTSEMYRFGSRPLQLSITIKRVK